MNTNTIPPNYTYTGYSDTWIENSEWEKHHGPYDYRPWWGIIPPPTYYDLRRYKTNVSTSTNNLDLMIDNENKSKIIDDLKNQIEQLKEKVNFLENKKESI